MSDYQVIQTMRVLGGSFARTLADLYDRADEDNQRRIRQAWPELWQRYAALATLREAGQRHAEAEKGSR